MKSTISSFKVGVAAFAVVFAFAALPLMSVTATETNTISLPEIDTPALTLPALTTESLTLTKVECKINVSSTEITTGGSVTISWETSGLNEIKINGETVSGDDGSYTIDSLSESTNFQLVGTNHKGGSCTANVYVTCVPPVHDPECTLDVDPQHLDEGESTTITWTTKNAASAELIGTNVDYGSVDLNGSVDTDALYESVWYMLNVTGLNGEEVACKSDVYVHEKEVEECELVIEKTVSTHNAVQGQEITYTIDIENTGSEDCTGGGVRILDELDPNITYLRHDTTSNISAGYAGGPVYREATRTLWFNGHTLEPNEKGTITWVGKVAETHKCEGFEVKNTAKATARELNNFKDWTYSNTVTTQVEGNDYKCDPTPPECPIAEKDGRIIIEFIDERLFSGRGEVDGQTFAQSIDVSAGTYDIRLVSYDGYLNRVTADQKLEQYQLEFLNGNTPVARSSAISDLADLVVEATNDEVVNRSFTLTSDTNKLRAVHAFVEDTSSPNSLYPICAAIDPVEEILPSCDFFTANPANINVGESTTLNWGTTNSVQAFINNGVGAVDLDGSVTVSPLEDTTYVLTVIGDKDTVVDCHVPVHVDDKPMRPECPFDPAPNRTIFEFDDRLRSDQSLGNSQTDVMSTSLEAGTYDISLASWDGYNGRELKTQPNEQWQLQFLATDTEVGISNAISDLPDKVKAAFVQEQVNSKYVLATDADAVRGVHAVYVDKSSANSLNPICAAVDKIEEPAPTCDLFTATPSTIVVGDSSTLNWETTNATRVVINNGIGEVDADGSVSVTPLVDTTYQMTVFGADDSSVDCEVPVKVSEDEVPVCKFFTATPGTLPLGGGDVVLDWDVEKATSVSIAPTVGTVDLTGSTTINVTESTTYTLTATDSNGDETTCLAPVAVPDAAPFTCENNVSFDASPNSITRGSNVTLDWNVVDADTVSISVIDAFAFSGSETTTPDNDVTYVLTATKGDVTIECPTSVNVSTGGGGGGSSSPRCELDISDERISLGEEITLTWDTSRANDVTLTDDLGNVIFSTDDVLASEKDDYLDGTITLSPTRDTEYTLLAERGSRDRECRVEVEVTDDIVVLQTRDQQPLVAGISLTSVPYTGFEAGPFMTFMFYALLVAWAFYIAYLVVARKRALATVAVESPTITQMKAAEETRPDVFVQSVSAPAMPANLPTGTTATIGYENVETPVVPTSQATDVVVTEIENRAHAQKALLSSDAVRHFVSTTDGEVERNEALDQVISEAKKAYPLEDGWIVINESRMQNLCEVCKVNAANPTFIPEAPVTVPEGVGSLAESIVTGNIVAAYEMIGSRPMFSLADAAADLDAVYRNRNGETNSVSDMLAAETAKLSEEQIKNMISSLTSALDGTYTDEASAVKMAIMKAVKEVA